MDRTANWCIGGCWFTLAPISHLERSCLNRSNLVVVGLFKSTPPPTDTDFGFAYTSHTRIHSNT
jgi:hypothetical protein